jgi:hypothetical protein
VKTIALAATLGLAVGLIAYWSGRRDGRQGETATAAQARVDTVMVERAARVDTVRVSARRAAALHDTVRIRDTVTLSVVSGDKNAPDTVTVTVPSVVVRRIVGDSILIHDQARLIAADSGVIRALQLQVKAIPRRRWYDDRITIGPSAGLIVARDGTVRAGLGFSVQIRVFGWP